MRVRTFVGILIALVVVVFVAYFTHQNIELLKQPFLLTGGRSIPVYVILPAVFLLGFLPVVSILLLQELKRDLAQRRDRRLSREAKSLRGNYRRAVDLQMDGQWTRAAAELEPLLVDRPEDFETLLRYGEVLRHLGRVDEAVDVHRRASILYPHSVAVLYQLAEDYEVRGEPEVAHQIRDRILRDFSGAGLQVIRRRRNAALGEQDWRTAAQLQEKMDSMLEEGGAEAESVRETGVRTGLAYQRGVDLLENESIDEARAIFRQILEGEPEFIPAAIMLGEASLLEGDERSALAEWRRGFERTGSPTFLQRIEDHFIEREQPLEAIETVHQLIAASDNDLLPRFFLGHLYYRLEMHEEALKALGGLGERIHKSPTYHYLLARIHERRGEMRKAVDASLACVRQAGIMASGYECGVCRTRTEGWQDRCGVCGSWGSIEFSFDEEGFSAEEVGRKEESIWAVYGRSGDAAPE